MARWHLLLALPTFALAACGDDTPSPSGTEAAAGSRPGAGGSASPAGGSGHGGTGSTGGPGGASGGHQGGSGGTAGSAGGTAGSAGASSGTGGASSGAGGASAGGPSTGGAAGASAGGPGAAGASAGGPGAAGASAGGSAGAVSSTCTPAPVGSFDPLASYAPPALVPTVVVTADADSGPGSLREALTGAPDGAVIGFSASLAGKTIALASTLELTRAVTLDGSAAPGLTLDGQKKVPLVRFNGDQVATVVIRSLRFVRGRTEGSGGAIDLNGGHLTVEIAGCRFEDNAAGEGGAVRVGYGTTSTTAIHDCAFVGNDGSVPSDRNGFSGGAVSAIGSKLTVSRCRFEGNHGPAAGAVYEIHADPLVEDSVFVDNGASGDNGSGAFFTDGGGPGDYGTDYSKPENQVPGRITVRRSRFEANTGKGLNGGASLLYAYPLDVVTLEDVVFRGNRAEAGLYGGKGGAIFVHADKAVDVRRVAFVDSFAQSQGGSIWADGSAAFTFENVLFSGNHVEDDRGGAATFNVSEQASLSFAHVTWVDNSAGQGCEALWLPGKRQVTVRNSVVASAKIEHSWEGQINFDVTDGGGNVEWPDPGGGRRSLAGSLLADPRLGAATDLDGTVVRPLLTGSPALGAAVAPVAAVDQRGAPREAPVDAGSLEQGASCAP